MINETEAYIVILNDLCTEVHQKKETVDQQTHMEEIYQFTMCE